MKYRKKPVIIEAYQTDKELNIETLEGTMHASVGDYIITGVRGEQYPCKPDIFEQTYEPADTPNTSPSAQPERLTDDDFETIRIHLNADKEKLCNQHRWKEAEEYQRIIDRFMAFASAQPERKKGKWKISPTISVHDVCGILSWGNTIKCSNCGFVHTAVEGHYNQYNYCPECGAEMEDENNGGWNFCPTCGADMRGDENDN